jgi:hypothetical protein
MQRTLCQRIGSNTTQWKLLVRALRNGWWSCVLQSAMKKSHHFECSPGTAGAAWLQHGCTSWGTSLPFLNRMPNKQGSKSVIAWARSQSVQQCCAVATGTGSMHLQALSDECELLRLVLVCRVDSNWPGRRGPVFKTAVHLWPLHKHTLGAPLLFSHFNLQALPHSSYIAVTFNSSPHQTLARLDSVLGV